MMQQNVRTCLKRTKQVEHVAFLDWSTNLLTIDASVVVFQCRAESVAHISSSLQDTVFDVK